MTTAAKHRKKGVLLVNLGSPDSTSTADVRRYLREFLSDPRVLDIPAPIRKAILNLFILPFRPRKSAEAYRTIWTDEGSPLIISTYRMADALARQIELPVAVGMRYGNPSSAEGVRQLLARGVRDILLIPLYPHYAMSSYETAVAKVMEVVDELGHSDVTLTVQPPFFDDPDYIQALVDVSAPYLAEHEVDHVLFSYHGIPERHVKKTDPSGCYCLRYEDCCSSARPHPAHAFCYRHQVFATTHAVAAGLGLEKDAYSVSFQSRLGSDPWLQPFTDATLERLPTQGKKHLAILCPAFISDCLETLEEIGVEGRHEFLEAGGKSFVYIPCLNEDPRWIAVLKKFVDTFVEERTAGATLAAPAAE